MKNDFIHLNIEIPIYNIKFEIHTINLTSTIIKFKKMSDNSNPSPFITNNNVFNKNSNFNVTGNFFNLNAKTSDSNLKINEMEKKVQNNLNEQNNQAKEGIFKSSPFGPNNTNYQTSLSNIFGNFTNKNQDDKIQKEINKGNINQNDTLNINPSKEFSFSNINKNLVSNLNAQNQSQFNNKKNEIPNFNSSNNNRQEFLSNLQSDSTHNILKNSENIIGTTENTQTGVTNVLNNRPEKEKLQNNQSFNKSISENYHPPEKINNPNIVNKVDFKGEIFGNKNNSSEQKLNGII